MVGVSLRKTQGDIFVCIGAKPLRPIVDFDGSRIVDEFGEWADKDNRDDLESYLGARINGLEFEQKLGRGQLSQMNPVWWSISECKYNKTGMFESICRSASGHSDKTESDERY